VIADLALNILIEAAQRSLFDTDVSRTKHKVDMKFLLRIPGPIECGAVFLAMILLMVGVVCTENLSPDILVMKSAEDWA
jgi:hypothetical protein